MRDQVVVTTVDKIIDEVDEGLRVTAESATLDSLIDTAEAATNIAAVSLVVHLVASIRNFLHVLSEYEHVLDANLLSDLDISTVHSADDQATVHDELHV